MASVLLYLRVRRASMNIGSGTSVSELSFEARGEASGELKPLVLSCGGMLLPYQPLSETPATWRQIVRLPGSELSDKIFGWVEN